MDNRNNKVTQMPDRRGESGRPGGAQSKNPWIGIALLPVMISGIVVGIASYATAKQ